MLVPYVSHQSYYIIKEREAQPPAKGGPRPQLTLIETYNGPQVTPSSVQHRSATIAFVIQKNSDVWARLKFRHFSSITLVQNWFGPNLHSCH